MKRIESRIEIFDSSVNDGVDDEGQSANTRGTKPLSDIRYLPADAARFGDDKPLAVARTSEAPSVGETMPLDVDCKRVTLSNPTFRQHTKDKMDRWRARAMGASIRVKPLLSESNATPKEIDENGSCKYPRNPYQRLHVVVFSAVTITVMLGAFQEVVLGIGISGCRRENMSNEECHGIRFLFISLPLMSRQLMCFAVAVYIIFSQSLAIRFCRRMIREGRRQKAGAVMSSSAMRIVAGHWTTVASADTFLDVAKMIAENQVRTSIISLITTVLATAAIVRLRITEWSAENMRLMHQITIKCCPQQLDEWDPEQCNALCQIGALSHLGLLTFSIGMLALVGCSYMFIPAKLWSPVVRRAVERTKSTHIQRMLKLPFMNSSFCVLNTVMLAVYVIDFVVEAPIPEYWIAVLVLDIIVVSLQLGIALWSIRWKSMASVPGADSMVRFYRMICGVSEPENDSAALQRSKVTYIWECKHTLLYRRLVLGICAMFAFAVDAIGTTRATSAQELWIIRILILLLLIVCKDKEADFQTLEGEGAGFGLVLDAHQLRKSLKCCLEGRPYKGCIKRYKGTLLRMCDTMTVSYRWQTTTAELQGLGNVNMSRWQMESLARSIRRSGCRYVWLDAFSVPQTGGELKRVLLARMMAVYASSFVTLVLLSREEESARYHQRVWTLQEYCSGGQLIVHEEAQEADGIVAVRKQEAKMVQRLRREHMARQPWCIPAWLDGDIPAMIRRIPKEDCMRIWETYKALRRRLECLYPEDTIRALYPLLWNCPAESQNELLELMDAIQHVHGIHQEDQTKLLLESCREQRMHNMRYPSAVSVSGDSTTLQHLLRHPSDGESILDNSQSGLLPIAVRSGMSRMISSFKNSLKLSDYSA